MAGGKNNRKRIRQKSAQKSGNSCQTPKKPKIGEGNEDNKTEYKGALNTSTENMSTAGQKPSGTVTPSDPESDKDASEGEVCSESDNSEELGKPESEEDIINVILKKLDSLPTKKYMDKSLKKLATKEDLKIVQEQTDGNRTQIEHLKDQCKTQEEELKKLQDKVADLEKKIDKGQRSYAETLKRGIRNEKTDYFSPRRLNLIIDGVKEAEEENLITTSLKIFKDMEVDVERRDINLALRINTKKRHDGAKFARPIRVCMINAHIRDEILKKKAVLKDKDKYNTTWVTADEDPETRALRKETRKIAYIAKNEGAQVQLKHDGIIIDGRRYWFNQLEKVPEKFRVPNEQVEKADQSRPNLQNKATTSNDQISNTVREQRKKKKSDSQDKMDVEVTHCEPEERMRKVRGSLVFSGETAKFSHFYEAPFIYKGNRFQCVEQGHSYYLALNAKNPALAKKVMKETKAVVMKQLVAHLEKDEKWHKIRYPLIQDMNSEKFDQHPELADKLIATNPLRLIEGTTHEYWAGGYTYHSTSYEKRELRGENKLGEILMLKRAQLIEAKRVAAALGELGV